MLQNQQHLQNREQQGYETQAAGTAALMNTAQGKGPNPALSQLQAATDQNNRAAASQIASTRGINPATAARLGAQQAGQMNQQAANQAATLSAQQQLSAQNALVNAGTQQQNLSQQAMANQNAAVAGLAKGDQAAQYGMAAGVAKGLSNVFGGLFAEGGMVGVPEIPTPQVSASAGMSYLMSMGAPQASEIGNDPFTKAFSEDKKSGGSSGGAGGLSQMLGGAGGGLKGLGALVGLPGLAHGGPVTTPELTREKKVVPGKAVAKGDSYANDKVPAILSPGEIVLPRTVVNSPNAPEEAAKFVAALLAKKNHGPKKRK